MYGDGLTVLKIHALTIMRFTRSSPASQNVPPQFTCNYTFLPEGSPKPQNLCSVALDEHLKVSYHAQTGRTLQQEEIHG